MLLLHAGEGSRLAAAQRCGDNGAMASEQPRSAAQGDIFDAADPQMLRHALEEAFSYRGDVTLTLADGSVVDGFVFDRKAGATLAESTVRVLLRDSDERRTVRWSEIRSVSFTGKDTAAGKTWENWVKRYAEKRLSGEVASIESESLD
jgi:hypothetical protein